VDARQFFAMNTKDVELPTAADIMITRVEALAPGVSIADAVETLLSRGYSGAPVVDERGRPIGVLSEHDCVRVLVNSLYDNAPTGTVSDYMTKPVETIEEHADLLTVAQRFAQGNHRRLVVVRDGALTGLITRRDLLRALDGIRSRLEARHPRGAYELIAIRRRIAVQG
jgi:CBS domain-containing protein